MFLCVFFTFNNIAIVLDVPTCNTVLTLTIFSGLYLLEMASYEVKPVEDPNVTMVGSPNPAPDYYFVNFLYHVRIDGYHTVRKSTSLFSTRTFSDQSEIVIPLFMYEISFLLNIWICYVATPAYFVTTVWSGRSRPMFPSWPSLSLSLSDTTVTACPTLGLFQEITLVFLLLSNTIDRLTFWHYVGHINSIQIK